MQLRSRHLKYANVDMNAFFHYYMKQNKGYETIEQKMQN